MRHAVTGPVAQPTGALCQPGGMSHERQDFFTPGSTGQLVAASIVALCGAFLLATAVVDANTLRAVVAGLQTAAGTYLVVWHLRRRNGR